MSVARLGVVCLALLAGCAAAPGPDGPQPSPSPQQAPTEALLGDFLRAQTRRLHTADPSPPLFSMHASDPLVGLSVPAALQQQVRELTDWTEITALLAGTLDLEIVLEESHFMAVLTPPRPLRADMVQVPLHEAAYLLGLAGGRPIRIDPAVPNVPVDLQRTGRLHELLEAVLGQAGDGLGLDDEIRALWLVPLPAPQDRQWLPRPDLPDHQLAKAKVEAVEPGSLQLDMLPGQALALDPSRAAPPLGAWGVFRLLRGEQGRWEVADWVVSVGD